MVVYESFISELEDGAMPENEDTFFNDFSTNLYDNGHELILG